MAGLLPKKLDNDMNQKTLLLVVFFSCMAGLAFAEENRGAKEMELFGGKRGKVPFPHQQHQNRLPDCQVCHSLFPQKAGAIEDYEAKGQLKNKQVMTKLCIQCHRSEKRAGRPTGPIRCGECHIK